MVTQTFSCKQESKTGCKFTKKVYDKSRTVKFGRQNRDRRPSEPIDGHDININDSINGHETVVADKQSSVSWLQFQTVKVSQHCRRKSLEIFRENH